MSVNLPSPPPAPPGFVGGFSTHPYNTSTNNNSMEIPEPLSFRPRPSLSSATSCTSDGFSTFDEASLPSAAGGPRQLQRMHAVQLGGGGGVHAQAAAARMVHHGTPRVPEDPAPAVGTLQRGWDTFRLLPPKPDRRGRGALYVTLLQLLKLGTFVILFVLTLTTSILAKSVALLMANGLGQAGTNVTICPDKIPESPSHESATRRAEKLGAMS
ncbi:hypothetical protein niasHT_040052 [Heterodera trifolii]|uniref:Uncharacterized protein n=1 Tax=Heterodera trifolii TaxID=157864 RepID=A0ABD2J5U1_9BILA